MRISDWSSDVCSSDLQVRIVAFGVQVVEQDAHAHPALGGLPCLVCQQAAGGIVVPDVVLQVEAAPGLARRQRARGERVEPVGDEEDPGPIGRAAWRERVCEYV